MNRRLFPRIEALRARPRQNDLPLDQIHCRADPLFSAIARRGMKEREISMRPRRELQNSLWICLLFPSSFRALFRLAHSKMHKAISEAISLSHLIIGMIPRGGLFAHTRTFWPNQPGVVIQMGLVLRHLAKHCIFLWGQIVWEKKREREREEGKWEIDCKNRDGEEQSLECGRIGQETRR